MSNKTIYVTEHDLQKLKQLLFDNRSGEMSNQYLDKLKMELERACVVSAESVPEDIVTMDSRVCIVDLDTGEEMIYTLVFPHDADSLLGKISVLAPIGTAMLGYRVGDEFEWEVPVGLRRLKVKELLYQPQTNGKHHRQD
jgi:regulator of nucleoside diphosphate kinase